MRETRNAQSSIVDSYSKHEKGKELYELSELLKKNPDVLTEVGKDFDNPNVTNTGARGLTLESILRCLILKLMLGVSYRQLSFHLSDSPTYRSFACLRIDQFPSHSALQGTVRRIKAETLERINKLLVNRWINEGTLKVDSLRIDSTVTQSNIAPPSDSKLLYDGIRVLSRLMFNSKKRTGVKIRFSDQRKRSKSISYRILLAKKPEKEALYPTLLFCANTTLKQVKKALDKVRIETTNSIESALWIQEVEHFCSLLVRVIDQTQRRVFNNEKVPSEEKIVSLFEHHTHIIAKGHRDVQYGHKINLATQEDGFVTYMNIEKGAPNDSTLFQPVFEAHQSDYDTLPNAAVADGCYASHENVTSTRSLGVKQVVFSKPVGLGYHDMGVKKKTFDKLRNFRAGVEGNISELKRAFGMNKATWKGLDGFKAYVWSSVLSYNLVRMVRLDSA